MENLENFINKNRNAFDSSNLSENHTNKFEKKLLLASKKNINVYYWFTIAAAILVLIGFSVVYQKQIYNNTYFEKQNIHLSDISEKYSEVEEFYKKDIDAKINEFEKLNCKIDVEQRKMVDSELKQLDIVYNSLQMELKNNKNDQRIINAMLNNYQNKVKFLELVINQIKNNC